MDSSLKTATKKKNAGCLLLRLKQPFNYAPSISREVAVSHISQLLLLGTTDSVEIFLVRSSTGWLFKKVALLAVVLMNCFTSAGFSRSIARNRCPCFRVSKTFKFWFSAVATTACPKLLVESFHFLTHQCFFFSFVNISKWIFQTFHCR